MCCSYLISFFSIIRRLLFYFFFFFFNDTATTEIYTLSLHDALPISGLLGELSEHYAGRGVNLVRLAGGWTDRKSTRLNSSHSQISYAVFCLKKKKKHELGIVSLSCRAVMTESCHEVSSTLFS